jgi:hypothetical protein
VVTLRAACSLCGGPERLQVSDQRALRKYRQPPTGAALLPEKPAPHGLRKYDPEDVIGAENSSRAFVAQMNMGIALVQLGNLEGSTSTNSLAKAHPVGRWAREQHRIGRGFDAGLQIQWAEHDPFLSRHLIFDGTRQADNAQRD